MKLKDAGIYDITNIFKGIPTALHASSQGTVINNKPRYINIPAYQRPYRWGEDNINKLFEDYDDNEKEYFLGSAVAVLKEKEGQETEFDVIDGQQRITTLYLLNYINYLLKKERYLESLSRPICLNAIGLCEKLRDSYYRIIGSESNRFDNIINKLNSLNSDTSVDQNEWVNQIIDVYKVQLCIADDKSTLEKTKEEIKKKNDEFFNDETLCLKYTRARYNEVLKRALSNVYLKKEYGTNNLELCFVDEQNQDQFLCNYQTALKTIFDNIWRRASQKGTTSSSVWDITDKAIEIAEGMITNLSLCVVITEDEEDANKLFEVLNDRALEVDDLELIKNHFYKEYCTKSNDNDDVKDKNITLLDEIWTDKVFDPNTTGDKKRKLISYYAAVYLTKDKELSNKDNIKMKDAIKESYSSIYSKTSKPYTYENILSDFNSYLAIKIIMDKFGYKGAKQNAECLKAEQEKKSVAYKAFHLLIASNMDSVLAALVNVIVSNYTNAGNSMTDTNFEDNFIKYIERIRDDYKHADTDKEKIYKCGHMLWTAALKAEDYVEPRNIARRIIEKYGKDKYDSGNMDFESGEVTKLTEGLNNWLRDWKFGDSKMLATKVILLNLLMTDRNPDKKGYKKNTVEIELNPALNYNLEANKLQLDHLEPKEVNPSNLKGYYKSDVSEIEQRQKDVNGYIGNFMILDADDNNNKNNIPLKDAIKYYDKTKKSWLVDDIKEMSNDNNYFDATLKVPKEDFFKIRSKHIEQYFKAFLDRSFNQEKITVRLK